MNRRFEEFLIKPIGWLALTLLLSLAIAHNAFAYELTFQQALDIAATAYQKQVGMSPYGQRELSIARSDGENNACISMMRFSNAHLANKASIEKQSEEHISKIQNELKERHYFTIIMWIVCDDYVGSNVCIFVDRISGDVIDFTSF